VVRVKAVQTEFWRPGADYHQIIVDSIIHQVKDGDIIVVSEKAISTAEGNILDESNARPGLIAKFLARFWMRIIWGYPLGIMCHLRAEQIRHLRSYPIKEGAAHKQVVLVHAGLLQAMKNGSEGGIDINNMPFSYACLPLKNYPEHARQIYQIILSKTGKRITVMIADTDSTFSIGRFHFTSRPNPIPGIASFGGFFTFIFGRALNLQQNATPLAVFGSDLSIDEALKFAEIAHHSRGYGAGRTIWDVSKKYNISFNEVTWEMLEKISHYPLVLVRR
jgi:F420-0:gamma-glutamyl ligase-like protein